MRKHCLKRSIEPEILPGLQIGLRSMSMVQQGRDGRSGNILFLEGFLKHAVLYLPFAAQCKPPVSEELRAVELRVGGANSGYREEQRSEASVSA